MDISKGKPAQPQTEGRGAAANLGQGRIHPPTELWHPQDPFPPPPPAMCSHASPPEEGNGSRDSGTKVLARKRMLLFRWLSVALTSPNLGCSSAAKHWEGRRSAVEEMLDVKESILEKAMIFPHPSSYLQFQTIYTYFFWISHIWFLAPLHVIWDLLTLYCLCTAQVVLLQEKGTVMSLLYVQHQDRRTCTSCHSCCCSGNSLLRVEVYPAEMEPPVL